MKTAITAITIALTTGSASAYSMTDGLRANCKIGAEVIYSIGEEAEKGAPDAVIEVLVDGYFSGLLDRDAMDYVAMSLSLVDKMPNITPTGLANAFLEGCMEDL